MGTAESKGSDGGHGRILMLGLDGAGTFSFLIFVKKNETPRRRRVILGISLSLISLSLSLSHIQTRSLYEDTHISTHQTQTYMLSFFNERKKKSNRRQRRVE